MTQGESSVRLIILCNVHNKKHQWSLCCAAAVCDSVLHLVFFSWSQFEQSSGNKVNSWCGEPQWECPDVLREFWCNISKNLNASFWRTLCFLLDCQGRFRSQSRAVWEVDARNVLTTWKIFDRVNVFLTCSALWLTKPVWWLMEHRGIDFCFFTLSLYTMHAIFLNGVTRDSGYGCVLLYTQWMTVICCTAPCLNRL